MDEAGRFKMTIGIVSYELHKFAAQSAEEPNTITSKCLTKLQLRKLTIFGKVNMQQKLRAGLSLQSNRTEGCLSLIKDLHKKFSKPA